MLCAIILAAGQGTRMKSSLPKVLHKVLGRPMIGHVVGAARAAGAQRIVVVVGHGRALVEEYLQTHEPGDDLEFVVQAQQLGTAHAVLQARDALSQVQGRTLILTGDAPNLRHETLQDFVRTSEQSGASLTFMSCHVPDPAGYGRIVRDEQGQVLRNVEHRDATEAERAIDEINAGFYAADNQFLWSNLSNVDSSNDQQEFYLPDLIAIARKDNRATAFVVSDSREVEGINTRLQLAQSETVARTWRNEQLMISGVTMIDPSTTYIDAFVEVEPDVLLEPCVQLRGKTRVASGCVIRQGCVVEDSVLETGVLLKPYSHLESSIVRQDAQIGPFAHIRPASEIGVRAKVGNFVEIKKTTLGEGTKAGHLSYLGDATIGKDCNIGAGTITCNYDGFNKSPTTMGDRVFIGSNSALVAPIVLEDGAYVGAGSTLTQAVPTDSLAVARGRQRNIPGWVARRRKVKP